MKNLALIPALFLASTLATAGSADSLWTDEMLVEATVASVADAWNHRDAKTFASLYAGDAEVKGASGEAWRGRDAIAAHAAEILADAEPYRPVVTRDVDVRIVRPGVAVARVAWQVAGSEHSRGTTLHILVKDEGRWLLSSTQPASDDEASARAAMLAASR